MFFHAGCALWLLPVMIPVEIIGLFSKPFALMVRLFANITAGHIIVCVCLPDLYFSSRWSGSCFNIIVDISGLPRTSCGIPSGICLHPVAALFISLAIQEEHH